MGQELKEVLKPAKELAKPRAEGKAFQTEGQSPKLDMAVGSRNRSGGQSTWGRVRGRIARGEIRVMKTLLAFEHFGSHSSEKRRSLFQEFEWKGTR